MTEGMLNSRSVTAFHTLRLGKISFPNDSLVENVWQVPAFLNNSNNFTFLAGATVVAPSQRHQRHPRQSQESAVLLQPPLIRRAAPHAAALQYVPSRRSTTSTTVPKSVINKNVWCCISATWNIVFLVI